MRVNRCLLVGKTSSSISLHPVGLALQQSMVEEYRRKVEEKREEVAKLQQQRDELMAAQSRLRQLCELKNQVSGRGKLGSVVLFSN